MTASPTAVPSTPKTADGGNALAALFAAAAASSMHRQISIPPTTSSPISTTKKMTTTKTIITRKTATSSPDKDANNSAAKLIASLLNGASNSPASTSSLSLFSTTPTSKTKTASSSAASSSLKAPIAVATATASSNHHVPKVATVIPNVVVKDSATGASSSSLSPTTSIATSASTNGTASTATMPDHVVLRNLESWHDEDEEPMDDSCYQELVDSGNPNGWSADEMFKYNEKRHKIMSSYDDKETLAGNYTTPLSKNKSKTTVRLATQLAKEIEQKVLAEGRVTPESSDDDELFEHVRIKRVQLKQQKQLDQFKNLKAISSNINFMQTSRLVSTNNNSSNNNSYSNSYSIHNRPTTNHVSYSARKSNKSSSQYSNSSTTPATPSLSSSPTLNDSNNIIKPVTSSSRNILRTCLT